VSRAVIRYLGHAGFVVEHRGMRLLIDPWFYPAFLGAWFPFPDNRQLLPEVTSGQFDALYVSHLHEDHFDQRVLAQLDRRVKVLLPRYRSKAMLRRFTELGFENLVLLGHHEQHVLAEGFTATMLLDTSHKEDSGLLVDLDGFRFLDLNDCNTALSELPGRIDLLAAQYSGAMWYPNCYAYPPDTMAQKVAAVRASLMDTLLAKVRLTGARAYLPSAGPACFLDPHLACFNDRERTIFPVWEDVSKDFAVTCPAVEVLRLGPGDTLDRVAAATVPRVVPAGCDPLPPDQDDYLARYRERRRDEWQAYHAAQAQPVTASEVEDYFRRLQRWNTRFLRDYRKDIRLVADGTRWGIRLVRGRAHRRRLHPARAAAHTARGAGRPDRLGGGAAVDAAHAAPHAGRLRPDADEPAALRQPSRPDHADGPGTGEHRDHRARRPAPAAVLPARRRGPDLRHDLRQRDRVPSPSLEVGHQHRPVPGRRHPPPARSGSRALAAPRPGSRVLAVPRPGPLLGQPSAHSLVLAPRLPGFGRAENQPFHDLVQPTVTCVGHCTRSWNRGFQGADAGARVRDPGATAVVAHRR
jgi:L-ascorbate metabolism protein UlaG (beta-lactamase superfamily)